jgi:hypothetical protein
MEISDEEADALITTWNMEEFYPKVLQNNIGLEDQYNANQTGLYHQKLPNRVYIDKSATSNMNGVKQMKDKTRITLMVVTSASGARGPLCLIGKAKAPECFRELEIGEAPPIAYNNQSNAWFTQKITAWWILNVFWPWHVRRHGDVKCLLLLDNCTAHKDMDQVENYIKPPNLTIVFFPPNLTSWHQPADMGNCYFKSRLQG